MASEQALPAPETETRITPPLPQSKYSKRVILKTILATSNDGGLGYVGQRVVIGGWVKSYKEKVKDNQETGVGTVEAPTAKTPPRDDVTCSEMFQYRIPLFRSIFKVFGGSHYPVREKLEAGPAKPIPSIAYLQVNDGSCVKNLQVVLDSSMALLSRFTPTGTSIVVEGVLRKATIPGKQEIELEVEKIILVGTVDHARYPLARTRIPLDSLRSHPHLRPRTTTVASVTRIRACLSQATHAFSETHGFIHVQMPVITGVDANGFSEKFQVIAPSSEKTDARPITRKQKSDRMHELKHSESNKAAMSPTPQDAQKSEEAGKDCPKDFFHRQMYLTVSGQLHLESYACALGSVYSFGPTFGAEKSQLPKHLAESWKVELELAFSDLEDVMNCAEDYLKFLCHWLLEHCSDDVNFVTKRIDKTVINRLQAVAFSSFERITYTEAVEALVKVTENPSVAKITWGVALTDEHEKYLAEEIYKKPVIIHSHPRELKPFFARINDDGKTVSTIDVVVPKVGALLRGSQKEERFDKLSNRIKELGLPREEYEWYLDLRRHGTVEHSGFGLEFDRMVLFATGLNDIRDVAAVPRTCCSAYQ